MGSSPGCTKDRGTDLLAVPRPKASPALRYQRRDVCGRPASLTVPRALSCGATDGSPSAVLGPACGGATERREFVPEKRERALRVRNPRFDRPSGMPADRTHEPRIAASSWFAVAVGIASRRSAARPATCGVAIDEPLISAKPLPGTQDRHIDPWCHEIGHKRIARPVEGLAAGKVGDPVG